MTTSAFEKFRLLSWKNWTIQSRHWVQTIFEVLIPVLCCSVILLIRGLVEVTDHPLPFFYNPVNISLVQSLP